MTSSLEHVVRPFQSGGGSSVLHLNGKTSPPVTVTILAGTGVKTFMGETSLTVTTYNKKIQREPTLGSGGDDFQNAFNDLQATLDAANADFVNAVTQGFNGFPS